MKVRQIFLPALVFIALAARGQEAPAKADPALDLMPSNPGQILPPPSSPGGTDLIPDAVHHDRRPKVAAEGESKTERIEKELADRVRFRQAETKALQDTSFRTEFVAANASRTDYEKRAALKVYFKRFYTRVRKIDPTLKTIADDRESYAIRRLTQVRISASEAPTGNFSGPSLMSVGYLPEDF